MAEGTQRRLAAIVIADVVGYGFRGLSVDESAQNWIPNICKGNTMNVHDNRRTKQFALLASFLSFLVCGTALGDENRTVNISTLNWSPYTGKNLPGSGVISVVIRSAFKAKGYDVRISTWPWQDAVQKAATGDEGIVGYFPGYHCSHHTTAKFLASAEIAQSVLGFAFHKEKRLRTWKNLTDLSGQKIGYVAGYASTEEFEKLEKSGRLTVLRNSKDVENLRLLANREIDLALIDESVFEYLMRTTAELSPHKNKLRFHPQFIAAKRLFLCFKKSPKNQNLKSIFDAGLRTLDVEKLISKYFREVF